MSACPTQDGSPRGASDDRATAMTILCGLTPVRSTYETRPTGVLCIRRAHSSSNESTWRESGLQLWPASKPRHNASACSNSSRRGETCSSLLVELEIMPIVRTVRTVDVPGYAAARFKAFELDAGRTGPVVTIAAGMGGTAYPGIEACWRLLSTLEQATFNGRVTILPILDTTGFMNRRAHFCALDDTALSTAFRSMRPGEAGVPESASVA